MQFLVLEKRVLSWLTHCMNHFYGGSHWYFWTTLKDPYQRCFSVSGKYSPGKLTLYMSHLLPYVITVKRDPGKRSMPKTTHYMNHSCLIFVIGQRSLKLKGVALLVVFRPRGVGNTTLCIPVRASWRRPHDHP